MGPIEMTSREIYDLVQQLNTRVIVLCEKVDRLGPDHEERIRALERARWPLTTVAVIVPILALIYIILRDVNLIG